MIGKARTPHRPEDRVHGLPASYRRRTKEPSATGGVACSCCGHRNSLVIDSRGTADGGIRRGRVCIGCERRYTTYEHAAVVESRLSDEELGHHFKNGAD